MIQAFWTFKKKF